MFGLIGAAIGAVGSIAGGALSASAARRAARIREEELKKREERQAATYARRVNQDYTQRADAQRMLKITREALKQRTEAAAGRQAVMGTTDSGLAAERELAGNVMADTASQIAAAGEAKKDEAEKIYEQQQDANSQERTDIAAGKAEATGQAVGQMVQGIGQAAGAIGGMFGSGNTTSGNTTSGSSGSGNIITAPKLTPPKFKTSQQVAEDLFKADLAKKGVDLTLGKYVPGYTKI